jgi:hypothetical protein
LRRSARGCVGAASVLSQQYSQQNYFRH